MRENIVHSSLCLSTLDVKKVEEKRISKDIIVVFKQVLKYFSIIYNHRR